MAISVAHLEATHRLTDEELVERFKNGDRDSLDTLMKAYISRTYRMVTRSVPEADAADVRQEIFLSSIESINNFKSGTSFAAWFACITKRRIADYYRRTSRRRDKLAEEQPVETDNTWRSIDDELTVRKALAQMPEGPKEVLSLKFIEGLSLGEISDRMGLTYEAARSRYRRAIDILKEKVAAN